MSDETRERWSVVVTLPDSDDRPPEVTDLVRRVGPYLYRSAAETAVYNMSLLLPGSAPEGTTLAIEPYDDSLPHLDGHPPTSAIDLAEAIRTEPDGNGGWGFPDLYARLFGILGEELARTRWGSACAVLAADEEAAEEERLAQQAERERLEPHRRDVIAAAAQRAGLTTDLAADLATRMLADLVDVAARHGVTRNDLALVTNLSGTCVDAVHARLSRKAREVTPQWAKALLKGVADHLEADHTVKRDGRDPYEISLTTLPALEGARAPLAVQLRPGSGWVLTFDRPGTIPVVLVEAGTAGDAARAVADIVNRVHRGELGDPFNGRR